MFIAYLLYVGTAGGPQGVGLQAIGMSRMWSNNGEDRAGTGTVGDLYWWHWCADYRARPLAVE